VKGERKERPRLSNFNTDHVDLANLGHRHLRIHVAVKDAFPNSIIKNQISYKILSSAVKALQDPAIAKSLESLEVDANAKMKVLEYVSIFLSNDYSLTFSVRSGVQLVSSEES
jgi:hypothetical protein